MNRGSIVQQVLMRMDEISPFANTQALQNVPVERFINQSAIEVLHLLPTQLIETTKPIPTTGQEKSTALGIGSIPLPTDYVKLAVFKMKSWMRPVLEAVSDSSPVYLQQFNKYTRGGVAKPVVAVVGASSGRRLEYYSVPATDTLHTVEEARYIPEMLPENFPDELIDPLAWYAAHTLFIVMGQEKEASLALQKVQQFISNRLGHV